MFIKATGDWAKFKDMGSMYYVDFHQLEGSDFQEKMEKVSSAVMDALEYAQTEGFEYVMCTHGYSTSGPFKTSARSIVRAIMRSKESTPFIIKNKSIQHRSVFIAKIKPQRKESKRF